MSTEFIMPWAGKAKKIDKDGKSWSQTKVDVQKAAKATYKVKTSINDGKPTEKKR